MGTASRRQRPRSYGDGRRLVFKLESFVVLPEKVERWRGTVLGSLQVDA
jgi:hypothetical protein